MHRFMQRINYATILASLLFGIAFYIRAEKGHEEAPGRPGGRDARTLILEGARREAERHTPYIMDYCVIPYPGGDVPAGTGVCTDLVVRAFRNAGVDLQKLLHEDRKAHPEAYPTRLWPVKRPDPNIDHRRCQNLVVWFRRHARGLPTATDPASLEQWQPGDVVFYIRKGADHPWHVAIVSDLKDPGGMPLIIDSYPPCTSESHRLDEWAPIQSHFRYEPRQTKGQAGGKETGKS